MSQYLEEKEEEKRPKQNNFIADPRRIERLMAIGPVRKIFKILLCLFTVLGVMCAAVSCLDPFSNSDNIIVMDNEAFEQFKGEKIDEYVSVCSWFDYDWELLLSYDAILKENDVTKVEALASLMDICVITEYNIEVTTEYERAAIEDEEGVVIGYERGRVKAGYPKEKIIYEERYTGLENITDLLKSRGNEFTEPYTAYEVRIAMEDLPRSKKFLEEISHSEYMDVDLYERFDISFKDYDDLQLQLAKEKENLPEKGIEDTVMRFCIAYESGILGSIYTASDSIQSGNPVDIEIFTYNDGKYPVVYFCQRASSWFYSRYGDSTVAKAGCGPTALAMVVSSLTEGYIEPPELSQWAFENGYKLKGGGSYTSLMTKGAEYFGLRVTTGINGAADLCNKLQQGKIGIALMGKGTFTNGGHYIVLRGITEDGKILVSDPNSPERSNKEWDAELICRESKGTAMFWFYE